MNLSKLFQIQRLLDDRILENKGLIGQDLLPMKILALQVELGELANEWRGFKFWSEDREPRTTVTCSQCRGTGGYYHTSRDAENKTNKMTCFVCGGSGSQRNKNPLLEEYVDCLHFILSIGLELPINVKGLEEFSVFDTYPDRKAIFIFNKLFQEISTLPGEDENEELAAYYNSFQWLLELGYVLGFTWEQIEQAYYSKNQINHERQSTGY